MKLLVIDNYDSFTYNLVQYLKEVNAGSIDVFRNDKISSDEIEKYDAIVLSPGPGLPKDAGLLLEIIQQYYTSKPILGICLGHQAIGEVFGGQLENLTKVYHGIATPIQLLDKEVMFKEIEDDLVVGRYHSWVVQKANFPICLTITAEDEQGQIMALRHQEYPVFGLQFHPESVLTPKGKALLKNFVQLVEEQRHASSTSIA